MQRKKKSTNSLTKSAEKQTSLLEHLLAKHTKREEQQDRNVLTARLLEAILSGTDQQLLQILEQWQNDDIIDSIVKAWGSTNSTILLDRLAGLVELNKPFTYPWIQSLLQMRLNPKQETMAALHQHFQGSKQEEIKVLSKLEGKLQLFIR